jgi:two-component system LytT family response regulator
MIRAAIIDDEQHSIDTLKWKLENYCPEVHILACFDDPATGVEWLRKNAIDLLFLDIEMPLMNGFDVMEETGSGNFEVIFITAYDNFGIPAVKINALDYLLKPVQNRELKDAVRKYQQKRGRGPAPVARESLSGRIALSSKESIEFVEVSDIVVCMASSNYTTLFMADGRKKIISRTLKEFEEQLTPYKFYRPHHSHLVNLDKVREYIRTDGGYLVMSNEMKIPVSKNRKEDLLSLLNG